MLRQCAATTALSSGDFARTVNRPADMLATCAQLLQRPSAFVFRSWACLAECQGFCDSSTTSGPRTPEITGPELSNTRGAPIVKPAVRGAHTCCLGDKTLAPAPHIGRAHALRQHIQLTEELLQPQTHATTPPIKSDGAVALVAGVFDHSLARFAVVTMNSMTWFS